MVEPIKLVASVVAAAMPYAVTFAVASKIINLFLGMAFKGKVEL